MGDIFTEGSLKLFEFWTESEWTTVLKISVFHDPGSRSLQILFEKHFLQAFIIMKDVQYLYLKRKF